MSYNSNLPQVYIFFFLILLQNWLLVSLDPLESGLVVFVICCVVGGKQKEEGINGDANITGGRLASH